ncbi:MAG: TIM barrel protein [Candidatus Nanoarchaeia archaeon]|jgi:endonuclease IV
MKVGIKTYTDEVGYKYLSESGILEFADFIEILPVPDNNYYKSFKDFDIPFRIHAPHQGFGAEPGDRKAVERTKHCIDAARKAADLFKSPTIVVHPGRYYDVGSKERAIDFLKGFNDKRFIVENLPSFSDGDELGTTADEIKAFIEKLNCGICLDFGHATLTERRTGKNYKQIINEFLKFNPKYFHIMGGSIQEGRDHKNLFYGDFDIEFFRSCIPKDAWVVLETPHDAEMQKKEINFLKTGKRI